MKGKIHITRHLFALFAMLFLTIGFPWISAEAAEHSASISVNRTTGECSYSVRGIDLTQTSTLTLQVNHAGTQTTALQTHVDLTAANCTNDTYTGSFSLEALNYTYDTYSVNITIGNDTVSAGTCDFSLHTDKLSMNISNDPGSASRAVTVTSTEAAGDVIIPGKNKTVSVMAWPAGSDEASAKAICAKTPFTEGGMSLTADISQAGTAYGDWKAKLVIENETTGNRQTLATGTYTVEPVLTSLITKKTKALEKKKAFAISLTGLRNAYGIKKVSFTLSNSKGKKIATISGTKKKADGSEYYSEITLKKLGYLLDNYTVTATLTDNNGQTRTLNATALADERAHGGTLSVTKKKNATCVYKLNKAYIPGNIKKVRFVLYKMNGKKAKKQGSYDVKGTAGKTKTTLKVHNEDTGKFKVRVYGYTTWGKKIFLNEQTYNLRKKDMGKNGWFYEKYAGKTYKFYYINNVKQTDLTDILNLKKSSSSNTNRLTIEVNRAASAVTIYLYNEETKKYDIPVKTCAVSVGSDTWTNAGTSGLNEDSSYTPLGNYSICTNGISVKYTLKEMHEPDGSIVHARWASHIVGNVYFHAIAVGAKSHYSLPSSTYNRLGSPASAGCIRMTVADAKWIYDYASTGTPVKISKGNSSKPGPLGKAAVIKTTGGINYDPTDPAVPDSRKKADYKAKRITGYMTKSGKRVGY